jgi:hypothetical protein
MSVGMLKDSSSSTNDLRSPTWKRRSMTQALSIRNEVKQVEQPPKKEVTQKISRERTFPPRRKWGPANYQAWT